MKHYKNKLIPEHEEKRLDKTTCDICGKNIKSKGFDVDDVCIERTIGSNYPESGLGKEFRLDICGACFDEKLIPFLESEGVNIKYEDWSY